MSSSHTDTDFITAAATRVSEGYPELFRHQTTGVAFLLSQKKAIPADDSGLSKTRTAIVAARESSPSGRVLVVCPASIKYGWCREIALRRLHRRSRDGTTEDPRTPHSDGISA